MNHRIEAHHQTTTTVVALPSKKSSINQSGHTAVTTQTPIMQPRRSRMRRALWIAGFLAVGATGLVFRLNNVAGSVEAVTDVEAELRQVSVITPERTSASEITLPATVQAYQATDLYARADGFLKAWHFDIGSQVKSGDVLAEIETPELDQELVQAIALLKQGQAEHQQAVAELDEAKADVTLTEANIVKAKANLDFSISQVQRFQTLLPTRAVAREEYEEVVRLRDARQAELESANAEFARRKTNLVTRQAVIDSREANVGNRQANVQRLRDLTGFQKVVAPFDGVVTRRNAEVGMLVTSGSNTGTRPLFSISQVDVLRVQASVPQSSALGIKPGDRAHVTIPERPDQAFEAQVARTAGAVDPTSRSLLVEVELPNRDSLLLPGVYAQVRFQSAKSDASWLIKAKALMMRSGGPHVVIVDENNSVHLQQVKLGKDFGTTVEVLGGLTGNERLVVNPADDLHEGEAVQVATNGENQVQVAGK